MPIQEEIKFNEAKRNFEDINIKLQEAIQEYDNRWYEGDVRCGITPEQYERLVLERASTSEIIPKRDFILFNNATVSEKSIDLNGNLPTSAEKPKFLGFLTNFIKDLVKRIIKKQEEKIEDVPIEEPKSEETEDISSGYTYTEITYDADEIIQNYNLALNQLIKASIALDVNYEKKLNNSPKGKVVDTKHDGPGILDDYRQSSWGIERICLDGFQNHLPADSKGTKCYLHFLVGNKWVDCKTAKKYRDDIKEVRFADNGVGFTADNLFYLHSTKTSEDSSAGQFGEGMKLASIAAVNLGLGLEFQSRNWIAFAGSEEKKLINTRNADAEETRKKLIYDVTVYNGEPINGSRTIFHTPTPEFIDYALQLPEKVLELGNIKPIFKFENTELIDMQVGGEAFVKGIYLRELNTFYSYNFNDANVNPDRNGFHQFDEKSCIKYLIANLEDIEIIKDVISRLIEYSQEHKLEEDNYYYWDDTHPVEVLSAGTVRERFSSYMRNNEKHKELWKKAFEETCSNSELLGKDGLPKKPILKTDYEIPEYLKDTLDDYILVTLPTDWIKAFKEAGVQTDRDIIPEYIEEKIETSLSLKYGDAIWDNQRITLDACQNHLPTDTKGKNIFLRFQTTDGAWHDYREFEQYEDWDIAKIKISDDGVGYDSKNLGLFASIKEHEDSSGKWGEGLKMLAAAAVRNGVKLELRSRDWIAIPETKTEILNEGKTNEQQIDRLVFTVKKRVDPKSTILDDGDNAIQGDYGFVKKNEVSSTTFVEPTPELISEFRRIRDSVLLFNPRTPIASVKESDILSTTGGQLFVRNILIPGNHQLKYTYHLKDFDIETRDRNIIKKESMQTKLREILENVDNEQFISEFLSNAIASTQEIFGNESFLEFDTPFEIQSESPLADKWIKTFKKKFGEKTSIRSIKDMDFNAYHQAQHMGLDMVTLPHTVARALVGLRNKEGQTIASYHEALKNALENTIPIPEEELTEHEKNMVAHLLNYNKILSLAGGEKEPIKEIKVYDYPSDYFGEKADGFASYGDTINLSRQALNSSILYLGHVFFHESDHAITGAEDASVAFRNFLSTLLSQVAAQVFPLQQSIEDNGVAQDVSVNDINKALDVLRQVIVNNQDDRTNSEGEEFCDN